MSGHAYHESLPGYDERHILHDGCEECEQRGRDLEFGKLDGGNFERMWNRAALWDREGLGFIPSQAERPMLVILQRIQHHLYARGVDVDQCPGTSYAAQLAALGLRTPS